MLSRVTSLRSVITVSPISFTDDLSSCVGRESEHVFLRDLPCIIHDFIIASSIRLMRSYLFKLLSYEATLYGFGHARFPFNDTWNPISLKTL